MASLFCCRSIHTVKLRIPLIQFPKRFPLEILFSGQPFAAQPQGVPVSSAESKAVASNVNMLEDTELPNKYTRATILPNEIAYIERGGPD